MQYNRGEIMKKLLLAALVGTLCLNASSALAQSGRKVTKKQMKQQLQISSLEAANKNLLSQYFSLKRQIAAYQANGVAQQPGVSAGQTEPTTYVLYLEPQIEYEAPKDKIVGLKAKNKFLRKQIDELQMQAAALHIPGAPIPVNLIIKEVYEWYANYAVQEECEQIPECKSWVYSQYLKHKAEDGSIFQLEKIIHMYANDGKGEIRRYYQPRILRY